MGSTPPSPTRPAEPQDASLEAAFRADRVVVLSGLAGITLLSWAYTIWMVRGQGLGAASQIALPHAHHRTPLDLPMLCVMWSVMMVAMMAPAAAPTVLMFARMNRAKRVEASLHHETASFVAGYLTLWTGYSLAASLLQWALHSVGLVSANMSFSSEILSGGVLIGAGIYQWTPLKNACLSHCRTPLSFLMTRWREGTAGALRMGLEHGTHCVLCCWMLMLLLLVAGLMNLLWMGAITALVLVEKLTPDIPWITRISGGLLIGWGLWILLHAWNLKV
jgi:predicted metal-binding membrane protein